MTAADARNQAENARSQPTPLQMTLLDHIANAARSGKFEYWVYSVVDAITAGNLEKMGYKVESGHDRNEYYCKISW